MSRATTAVGALVLAAGITIAAGGSARAAETANCEVPIIHAVHDGDGRAPEIDGRIQRLKPYLEKAPFTAWHEFKLLERKELQLPLHDAARFQLPNGREASLTFLAHSSGPGDDQHRMRLKLTIEDKAKGHKVLDTTFVLDEGGVVLQVGQHYQGGVLVLGVSCKTQN
jgi:hypothetical protein